VIWWKSPVGSVAIPLLLSFPMNLGAGQFKRSLGRGDSIKTKLATPPAVRIGRSSLAIDVKDATGGALGPAGVTSTAAEASGAWSGAARPDTSLTL